MINMHFFKKREAFLKWFQKPARALGKVSAFVFIYIIYINIIENTFDIFNKFFNLELRPFFYNF